MKRKPLNYQFTELNNLRKKMGAEIRGKLPPKHSWDKASFEKLTTDGIDITDELAKEIIVNDDNTLSCNGARILIYIRDWFDYGQKKNHQTNETNDLLDSDLLDYGGQNKNQHRSKHGGSTEEESGPKFHFSECSTYIGMKKDDRKGRYVMRTMEDGNYEHSFKVRRKKKLSFETLEVCKNCLDKIEWEGYNSKSSKKNIIFQEFTLSNFFEKYPVDMVVDKPNYDDATAPINDYSPDWDKRRKRVRRERGNKCEICSATGAGVLLDVHHMNAEKWDNSDSNLQLLCRSCHEKQPRHSHMKALRK